MLQLSGERVDVAGPDAGGRLQHECCGSLKLCRQWVERLEPYAMPCLRNIGGPIVNAIGLDQKIIDALYEHVSGKLVPRLASDGRAHKVEQRALFLKQFPNCLLELRLVAIGVLHW